MRYAVITIIGIGLLLSGCGEAPGRNSGGAPETAKQADAAEAGGKAETAVRASPEDPAHRSKRFGVGGSGTEPVGRETQPGDDPDEFVAPEEGVTWEPWSEAVVAKAEKDGKLVLIDVYADWCGPCRMMDRTTYRSRRVLAKLESYIAVKVNADVDGELAQRFGTGSLPTTTVLNSQGRLILKTAGYMPPEDFVRFLETAEGNLAELKRMRKKAEDKPADGALALDLGRRYLEMGWNAEAVTWLTKALDSGGGVKDEDRADATFQLGEAELRNKAYDAAVRRLRGFVKTWPTHPRAREANELIDVGRYFAAGAKAEAGDYAGARKILKDLAENSKHERVKTFAQAQYKQYGVLGQAAPALQVAEWVRGEAVTLEQLRGKVVLLDLFQIICPGCERARPYIVEMQQKYGDQGLQTVSVAVAFELEQQQTKPKIREYVKRQEFAWPVAIDKDFTKTFTAYASQGTPFVALIDRAGTVRHLNYFRPDEVERKIRELLAEKAAAD